MWIFPGTSTVVVSLKSISDYFRISETTPRTVISRRTAELHPKNKFPSCIIFGVSKGGTRAVQEYLKLHPDVVAPSKELHFFDNATLQNEKGEDWYLSQLPSSKPSQIVVDKSPDYFQHTQSAKLIFKANNKTKLLLLLRDPVERLVSEYMQLVEKNPLLPPFEDWVIDVRTGQVNTKHPSVMVGAYSQYLAHWLEVFPRNQIHIIESFNLRVNPVTEMNLTEKFLGLRPFLKAKDFYYNATRGFYCMRLRASGVIQCLGKSKGRTHPAVREDVMEKLREFYYPYNLELNRLLNMKFPWSRFLHYKRPDHLSENLLPND